MPTDINFEKRSLVNHLEIRVEKDKAVELRFENIDKEIAELKRMFADHTARLLSWGAAIIAVLFSSISYLITKHFLQ